MVSKRHILLSFMLICSASAIAFSQTGSSRQFIATPPLVVHGTLPGSLGGVGIVAVADFNGDHRADVLTSSGEYNSTLILYTQNSDGSFTAGNPLQLPAGNPQNGTLAGPDNVKVADINGDGIPDLIVGMASDLNQNEMTDDNGAICIYFGNGDGTFRYHGSFSAGQTSNVSVMVKDLNGDGRPDLLVQTSPPYALVRTQIFLNQGDGNFRGGQSLGTNEVLAAGAFGSSGQVDLVAVNPLDGMGMQPPPSFQILKGNGDGTFTSGPIYPVSGASIVTVGDLNGDHHPDLVVTNSKNSTVFLGEGDGTFKQTAVVSTVLFSGTTLSIPGAAIPLVSVQDVYIADFNKDGNPDIAVVSSTVGDDPQNDFFQGLGEIVAIYPGNGTGTFHNPRVYNVDSQATSDALADIKGNGVLDFLVAGQTFSLLAADGHGNFVAPVTTLTYAPTSIARADFNRDGIPDLAVVNPGRCDGCNGAVSVLTGSGKGYLNFPRMYSIGMPDGIIVAGDVNGDGNPDLVVTRRGRLNGSGINYDPIDISVLLGRGDGTFERAMNFTVLGPPAAGTHDTSAFLVDINHDGKLDLVGDWGVAFGNGNGTFGPPIPLPSAIGNISAMALKDFNRDGFADLAIATSSYGSMFTTAPTALYTLLGNGKGTFRIVQKQENPAILDIEALAAADINKDGIPDLVFTTLGTGNYLNAELGKGNGTFAGASRVSIGSGDFFPSVVVADFDRDGNPDVALSDNTGTIDLLRGTGKGTFLPPTSYDAFMTSMVVVNLNAGRAPDIAGTTPVGVVRVINTGHRNYAAAPKLAAK